jgi:hypothetical protein
VWITTCRTNGVNTPASAKSILTAGQGMLYG